MLKKSSCIIFVLLLGYFWVFPSLGYAQGQVSHTAPNDPTTHPLTIGHSGALKGKFRFTVGSDGIMIRIDNVSDSGSAWTGTGFATSTANFTGTPNSGSTGTFVPNFSGRVRYLPSPGPSGPLPEYEWTAKATYKLNAKFNIVLDFTPGDDFEGRSKTAMGVGEIADIKVIPINPPDAEINITSITTSGKILRGSGIRVTADDTAGSGTITVKATVNDSTTEYTEILNVTVLEPTGVEMILQSEYNTMNGNLIRKGMCLKTYLKPTNVSFYQTKIIEDVCPATDATPNYQNASHPAWTTGWASTSKGNITTGCLVEGPNIPNPPKNLLHWDFAGYFDKSIPLPGHYTWKIPWKFRVGSGTPKTFTDVTQKFNITYNNLTVEKFGISKIYQLRP
jgi:hypothetical protein